MREAGKIQDVRSKGDLGEEAVFNICLDRQRRTGGLLYQSYKYPYQENRQGKIYLGNIKLENGKYFDVTSKLQDEIDILYVTSYRIFAIEVKSYHATIQLYDHWMKVNGSEVEKSVVTQSEKHARHLYHAIHDVLPNGNPNYIVPMMCFVDRCKVQDERSPEFAYYVPVSILNNFKRRLLDNNTPLEYNLDIVAVKRKLDSVRDSVKKEVT